MDMKWLEEQEKIEKTYDIYYKTPVDFIWISLMYVDNNEIEYIKKEKVFLNKGTLSKKTIVKYINKHKKLNTKLYKLSALAMFNMSITPEQILSFDYTGDYFKNIEHIEDIVYSDTISYLSSVNELFILLTPTHSTSNTKKIRITRRNKTRRSV